jgi:hypothetical protein
MATRKLVLSSAAILAGALIASVPGLAQQAAPADQAAYDAAQAHYNQAKAKYDTELRDYNNKTSAYQKQRDEYNAKLNAYSSAQRHSDVVVVPEPEAPAPDIVVAAPAPNTVVVTDATPSNEIIVEDPPDDFARRLAFANQAVTLWRVDRIDANHDLFNAPVLDSAGLPVGHFRRVEIKEPGYPAAVITLNTVNRTISLPIEHVRFDPNTGVVIADLPASLIFGVPSGFPVG